MNSIRSFADFDSPLREFIRASSIESLSADEMDATFNRAVRGLFALQYAAVPTYRKFCDSQKISPGSVSDWSEVPAVSASAFKELELTSLHPDERALVFHSSGTTTHKPSRHFHSRESLSIYEASLLPWFQKNFLAGWLDLIDGDTAGAGDKPGFIFLTPPPAQAPHSSLVHMFEVIRREWGGRDSFFAGRTDPQGAWEVEMESMLLGLRNSMGAKRPVAILGTAFSFVHLLDYLAASKIHLSLATGSRVMETGGYKGRSREIPRRELHALISEHLGIPADRIVCEYGMSELSSQAYARRTTPSESRPVFRFPPWVRTRIICPETGNDAAIGETGLIRVYDLANVRSVLAIQTGDLAIRGPDGFDLLGRAGSAEPRGCSFMTAETN